MFQRQILNNLKKQSIPVCRHLFKGPIRAHWKATYDFRSFVPFPWKLSWSSLWYHSQMTITKIIKYVRDKVGDMARNTRMWRWPHFTTKEKKHIKVKNRGLCICWTRGDTQASMVLLARNIESFPSVLIRQLHTGWLTNSHWYTHENYNNAGVSHELEFLACDGYGVP